MEEKKKEKKKSSTHGKVDLSPMKAVMPTHYHPHHRSQVQEYDSMKFLSLRKWISIYKDLSKTFSVPSYSHKFHTFNCCLFNIDLMQAQAQAQAHPIISNSKSSLYSYSRPNEIQNILSSLDPANLTDEEYEEYFSGLYYTGEEGGEEPLPPLKFQDDSALSVQKIPPNASYAFVSRCGLKTISLTHIDYLDANLDRITSAESRIVHSDLVHPSFPWQGLEDVRIFHHDGQWYYVGCGWNESIKKIGVCIDRVSLLDPKTSFLTTRFIRPTFLPKQRSQKNWVFFFHPQLNKVCLVYEWYPMQIGEVDYNKNELNIIQINSHVPKLFKEFRGSSCGVAYGFNTWFVVHIHRQGVNLRNKYIHFLVVFDSLMKVIGISRPFTFENYSIEFCLGLQISHDTENPHFLFSYSTDDKTSKIAGMSVEKTVNLLMKPVKTVDDMNAWKSTLMAKRV